MGTGEIGTTGTTVEVTVVGGLPGKKDEGVEEIMVVVGHVVTVVIVKVWVRVTGLVTTDDAEEMVM